jgi:hypothetical protein
MTEDEKEELARVISAVVAEPRMPDNRAGRATTPTVVIRR